MTKHDSKTADDTHAHSLTESCDYVFIGSDGEFVEKNRGEDFELY